MNTGLHIQNYKYRTKNTGLQNRTTHTGLQIQYNKYRNSPLPLMLGFYMTETAHYPLMLGFFKAETKHYP